MSNRFAKVVIFFVLVTTLVYAQTNQEQRLQRLEQLVEKLQVRNQQQEQHIEQLQGQLGDQQQNLFAQQQQLTKQEQASKDYSEKLIQEYIERGDVAEMEIVNAGYDDGGFFISSFDGNFQWFLSGAMQWGLAIFENDTFEDNTFYPNGLYVINDIYLLRNWHAKMQLNFNTRRSFMSGESYGWYDAAYVQNPAYGGALSEAIKYWPQLVQQGEWNTDGNSNNSANNPVPDYNSPDPSDQSISSPDDSWSYTTQGFGVVIEDAYFEYVGTPEFQVRLGQFIVPWTIAGIYNTYEQLGIWNAPFINSWSHGYDPGLMITGVICDVFEYYASLHNGEGLNTMNGDDDFLMSAGFRIYFMGKSKNAGSYFHFGFLRSRDDSVHFGGNVNSAGLVSPWGRPVFDGTWGTDSTRGWKTGVDVGFRYEDWLGKDKRIYLRMETEWMWMRWERDFSEGNPIAGAIYVSGSTAYTALNDTYYTVPPGDALDDNPGGDGDTDPSSDSWGSTSFPAAAGIPIFWYDDGNIKTYETLGRLPQLEGWGFSFASMMGFNLFPDVEESMLYFLFKFDYSDIDNNSSDSVRFGAQIRGQRIWNYTTGIGYAFNKYVRCEFNYVITLLDEQNLYGGAKNDRFTAGGPQNFSGVNPVGSWFWEPASNNQGSDDVEHSFFFQATVQF